MGRGAIWGGEGRGHHTCFKGIHPRGKKAHLLTQSGKAPMLQIPGDVSILILQEKRDVGGGIIEGHKNVEASGSGEGMLSTAGL